MWILIVGGLMITLPALVVAVWNFGEPMMYPALFSFAVNSLPFIAAYWMLRKRHKKGDIDLGH